MSLPYVGEKKFCCRGVFLSAKEWGVSGSIPVIALHGWLDNAATFDRMIPHIKDMHILAVDSAGHGLSDFRSPDAWYDLFQEVHDVISIAKQMNWDRFSLIGHSRGALIAALVAGVFPRLIRRLFMIDGHISIAGENHDAARQLGKSIREEQLFTSSGPTFFTTFRKAVIARANGFLPLEEDAAEVLAKRGVRKCDRGYYWHNDQRLKCSPSLRLTRGQIENFLEAITAPTKMIMATKGVFVDSKNSEQHIKKYINPRNHIANFVKEEMDGGHHLHLESRAKDVACSISQDFGLII
ncbi:MAG: alpha/beta hydrolase [Porticoccaceae bacterium]|nr:alpha/beta hydrolase [Porticoccaceae bacterium]